MSLARHNAGSTLEPVGEAEPGLFDATRPIDPMGPADAVDAADPAIDVALPIAPMEVAAEPARQPAASSGPVPKHVARHLVSGTSALGAGIVAERGMGFVANALALRWGGPATFGAYALAISTANSISTYAAGQIGATAARFSGKYRYGTAGYATLARVLAIVSLVSAALAAGALWLGAKPIAHLIGKESLTGLLRWAAVSAVGIVLLECARGFFTGQRRIGALLTLSGVVGLGMVSVVPMMAGRHLPTHMIVAQGMITAGAVVVCLLLARPLGLLAPKKSEFVADGEEVGGSAPAAIPAAPLPLGPMLREVWAFGFVQLAGLVASNVSGWWLMTLVARGDTTLVQMGFFSVASQLRNMVGLVPGLLTEGSYAIMADPDGEAVKTPQQVMGLCTFGATVVSLGLASAAMIAMPLVLKIFGRGMGGAAVACAVALAVAVSHMGNAPAAARLSIVSIRSTGVINTVWAVLVALAATVWLFHGGTAARALGIYFAAHIVSAVLVLLVLARRDTLPDGMLTVFATGTLTVAALAAMALLRSREPGLMWPVTGAMLLLTVLAMGGLLWLGRRRHWVPAPAAMRQMLAGPMARMSARFGGASASSRGGGSHAA